MDITAESQVSPTRTAMTIGAVSAASMLMVFAVGLQILGWIVFVGGVYFGMKRYRKETGDSISYFKALNAGIQTAFFASVILAFVSYVSSTMDPSLIDATLDSMEQQLKLSNVPSGLAEMVVQQWRETLSPVILAVATIFMCSAIGCLISVVCAFFIQNDQLRVVR